MRAVTWRVEGVELIFGQQPDPICLSHALVLPLLQLCEHIHFTFVHVFIDHFIFDYIDYHKAPLSFPETLSRHKTITLAMRR